MEIFSHWMMVDWDIYRKALLALLAGLSPYSAGEGQARFFNAAWTLIFIYPFKDLPDSVTVLIYFALASIILLAVCRKMQYGIIKTVLIVASPFSLYSVGYGNLDSIAWLGLALPTPLALLFLSIKPQSTMGIALVLLLKAYDKGKWKELIKVSIPVILVNGISILLYGIPPSMPTTDNTGNFSFFPYSLLLGIPALIYAVYKRSIKAAAFSSPFLTYYVTVHGYMPISVAFPVLSWMIGFFILMSQR